MLCKRCGAELPDDVKKCIFCGAVLDDEELDAEITDESVDAATEDNTVYDENEQKRREQIDKMMNEKRQQLSEIAERRTSKKQKQKRNKILIIALIVVVLAAGAGIGAFYIKDNIDKQRVTTVTPTPTSEATLAPTVSPEVTASPSVSILPSSSPEAVAGSTNASTSTGASTSTNDTNHSWNSTGNTGSGSATSNGTSSGTTGGSSSNKTQGSSSTGSSTNSSSSQSSQSSPSVSPSGISSNSINSTLSRGGEVIYNKVTGKYLMTFVAGNTLYYANVSEGSTTDQIKGKSMTVTATPTGETYNGNTVYEISSLTSYNNSGYILKDSGTRLLTVSDISGLSKEKLALARNEIYARHGRKFQMSEYSSYFNSCSWYSVNPNYNYNDDNSNLNSIEIKNVELILKAENSK